MTKSLFNQFEEVSSKAWKQKIQVDLKGADYNDTLIWKTYDDIDVKPFYHADQFEALPLISNTNITDWKVCQTIVVKNTKEANTKAHEVIKTGAESILFIVENEVTLKELITGLNLKNISVDINIEHLTSSLVEQIEALSKISANDNINFNVDIIGHIAKTGNWYSSLKEDHSNFEKILRATGHISIDTRLYHNSGANNVQQLAYAMAHIHEYLNHFEETLIKDDNKDLQVTFLMAVGSNYFFEIAKLRALRKLWAALALEYKVNSNCRILSTPSKRNKTIYDYNVNMLRTTTECMSAIIGGSDIVSNLAYDALYHKDNEFGSRIARNQLLILKHESYFDKVNNPADGAYYIEKITSQLAEKALDLFKDIEANGGFLSQLKEGTIQRKIKESASKEQDDFDNGKLVLLGSNKHPNTDDKMKNELDISPFLKVDKRKTLIEPIIEKRLSEKLEISRLNDE
ncbi:methylmalonyl-CoA mutase subunit beta [Winogradskyella aurantia]|uniref:Methylmalonyl-CoA mutase n=1 Tax=Winogradskyella aurantia TaxID=1915063 RepID=A0A265URC1_9FLAO|nr:methylmalonyl-CoA mutase subunit beta [Winogradskyella aurantia]OZV67627.1 methylmalonyl-CoA mutase [Winogradskyella aurantia]